VGEGVNIGVRSQAAGVRKGRIKCVRRETEKRSLSFRGARSDEESAFELSVHDSRITIHEKGQIPHPKEARIRDDRARAKG